MGRLITAEFRKILTVKAWWTLMIPTVALALLWSWIASSLTKFLASQLTQDLQALATTAAASGLRIDPSALDLNSLPWSSVALVRAIGISTIMPMLFGALALSNEMTRRTITTTYLTASTRGALFGAKCITYAIWGALFGVVITGVASLGIVIGSPAAQLPPASTWIGIVLLGIALSVFMTLLGVGVGALLGSVIGSTILLLLYMLLVENLATLALPGHWPGILINTSADGMVASLAAQTLANDVINSFQSATSNALNSNTIDTFNSVLSAIVGSRGAFEWWASGLIFAGWTALFVVLGWVVNRRRNIT